MSNRRIGRGSSLVLVMILFICACSARAVVYDPAAGTVIIADGRGNLELHLSLNQKCVIDSVKVLGREVAAPGKGCLSAVNTAGNWFSSGDAIPLPRVSIEGNAVRIEGIRFGEAVAVEESWKFVEQAGSVLWRIERTYAGAAVLDDTGFPGWNFANLETWTGALLDTGGVAWCRLMGSPNATYGVHGASAMFWNKEKGDCLRIAAVPEPGCRAAMRFSHQPDGAFSCYFAVTPEELRTKHDLRRFLHDKQDVWAPFPVAAAKTSVQYTLEALNYEEVCDRGVLKGIDGAAVREICNTIGRIGVIDAGIMGSNGWYSGYAVLHEQWLAQMGLAINDPAFFRNYAAALDLARDRAISPEGRVKSRWAHAKGDEIPGTYDNSGFYEAQWGILWDSQPGYVTNVAELFEFTGDLEWLRGQKAACEKVLNLALGRDSNGNGLLECMNDSHTEAKGSDWIDVVWAAFENGFVNAEMFNALLLWADAEEVLNDPAAATGYRAAAARIREQFNKPLADGGLWNPRKQWYAYWRDKDGSVHGDNFVTPVNLMAVAYGLCDDPARTAAILDQLEQAMVRENLFFWPLCVYSYQPEEAYKVNWPFPNYENGDIFLAWGEVGVRAYAGYRPELAVKYVKNVLDRYNRDGLAFQRYRRNSQAGEGDDILANNLQPVTGLYRNIYGIQPKHNRLHLDPHITEDLAGTQIKYLLRGREYRISLETDHVSARSDRFTLRAETPCSLNVAGDTLEFFPGQDRIPGLTVSCAGAASLEVAVGSWSETRKWRVTAGAGEQAVLTCVLAGLEPGKRYSVGGSGEGASKRAADAWGLLNLQHTLAADAPLVLEVSEEVSGP